MISAGYTDGLKSVRIIHDDIHRIDFAYVAEFFRYMGILVCENILIEPWEKTPVEEDTKCSVQIYVGRRKLSKAETSLLQDVLQGIDGWENIPVEYEGRVSGLWEEGVIFLYDIMPEPDKVEGQGISSAGMLFRREASEQKEILTKLMAQVFKTIYGQPEATGQLQKLISLFVDTRLWFHSLNLQYYAKRRSSAAIAAESAFLDACKRFQEDRAEQGTEEVPIESVGFLRDYALLWCEVKANLAADACRDILPFPLEELAFRCGALCRKYPDYPNAKVLLGLCYEPSGNYVNEALQAFHEALKIFGHQCYASSVYYWVGKRFEPYKNYRENAKRFYYSANKCKRKFRNYFKIGVFAKNEGKYSEAAEAFQVILKGLDMKRKMGFVDPLEIEYLFKTCTQLAFIYYKVENYVSAIDMGEEVIGIVERFIQPQKGGSGESRDYFSEFYAEEEEVKKYRKILSDRLIISTAYKIIYESYVRIGKPDQASQYWEKAME